MCVCVCNDECMCIVWLMNNTILVLMYVDVRLVTDYYFKLGLYLTQKFSTTLMQK